MIIKNNTDIEIGDKILVKAKIGSNVSKEFKLFIYIIKDYDVNNIDFYVDDLSLNSKKTKKWSFVYTNKSIYDVLKINNSKLPMILYT
jgi:hypothetical protein